MNYALIENGIITNIIWLYEGNAEDFPGAVPLRDRPVQIGDTYANGVFARDSVPVQTPLEAANETIAGLDNMVVEMTYQNVMMELGL